MADILLYDGHCRLCSKTARTLRTWSGDALVLQSFREEGIPARYGVTIEACEAAMHLVRDDGPVMRGVLAFSSVLRRRWFGVFLAPLAWPGVHFVAERVYALVSRWRFRLMGRECSDGCSIYQ